jgi:hypothetical protein
MKNISFKKHQGDVCVYLNQMMDFKIWLSPPVNGFSIRSCIPGHEVIMNSASYKELKNLYSVYELGEN